MAELILDVTVADGKYRVIMPAEGEGGLYALRHDEPWRDLTGDKLVYSLACELDDARKQIKRLEHELETEKVLRDEERWGDDA